MKKHSTLRVPSSNTKCVLAIICSNSFSHCKVDQKKTIVISQMFNHVQLSIHWMHLLNTRICRYTYLTPTVIYCDQDRYVMNLLNLRSGPYRVQVRCISNKIGYKLLLFLSAQPDYMLKCWKKIIARKLCFMHQGIFRPNYISKNDAYYLDFRTQKFPLISFNLNPF